MKLQLYLSDFNYLNQTGNTNSALDQLGNKFTRLFASMYRFLENLGLAAFLISLAVYFTLLAVVWLSDMRNTVKTGLTVLCTVIALFPMVPSFLGWIRTFAQVIS